MLTNLSKLNLLVARNNKGPIERNASLQVLLRNQNIPKLNESFTTKDLLSSLSLQKKEIKSSPNERNVNDSVQTLYKLNQNTKSKDNKDEYIINLNTKIYTLKQSIASEEKNYDTIKTICNEWLKLLFENEKKTLSNDAYSIENKQLLKTAMTILSMSVIIIYDYYDSPNINKDPLAKELLKMLSIHSALAESVYQYKNSQNSNIIRINCKLLSDIENVIITNQNFQKKQFFLPIIRSIRSMSLQDMNKFYIKKIKNETIDDEQYEDDNEDQSTSATISPTHQQTFLIPFASTKPLTLVLDLDETLVYVNVLNSIITLRPGLRNFLNDMSRYYELIIFTTSLQEYADGVLSVIEKDRKYFAYKLYRQHAHFVNNKYIKNLSLIGRDLSKTIIVDDKTISFEMQKENAILIKPFYDKGNNKETDFVLYDLSRILTRIALEFIGDVRVSLKKYKSEIDNKISC